MTHTHEQHEKKSLSKPAHSGGTFTCPMHPDVRSATEGMCPHCGMNLVPVAGPHPHTHEDDHEHDAGIDKHEGHHTEDFLKKFWVSLALTIPVLIYSDLTMILFHWMPPIFPGSRFIGLVLGSIVFWYGGWVFLKGAEIELRGRAPGMMTLIGLATSAAYIYSIYAVVWNVGMGLWWELTSLIAVMLLGHWIEMKAVARTQGALGELAKLLPDTAEVIRGKEHIQISLADLREGDRVFIRPGGKVPADGVVRAGTSEIDESMISGESKPVAKHVDSEVIAGTINGDGALTVAVTKIGERTFLAGVMRLVVEAQASKSKLQILSDRAASYLTLIAVVAGGATFLAWVLVGAGINIAVERLVAVLVIACPHALGLAVPLVASISTTLAARNGFLIRDRLALESARDIDTVIFDKTGTLTTGEYGITDIFVNPDIPISNDDVVRLAASIDSHSEHFIARAIVQYAKKHALELTAVSGFQRIAGKGVRGVIDGKIISVGGERMADEAGAGLQPDIIASARRHTKEGKSVIFVISGKVTLGMIALADTIREESREAVRDLRSMGIAVAMLTGDSNDVAEWVARDLGIEEYFAKVLPGEKTEKVKLLQSRGQNVAMVGDGINDAPALTQADVGIAIGAGTNVAIESAGIILMRNDPRDIAHIIALSHMTYSKMIQNLWWATGYNIIALPLAAGVLAAYGIILQPAASAILMSLSTVIVSVNAELLGRKKI